MHRSAQRPVGQLSFGTVQQVAELGGLADDQGRLDVIDDLGELVGGQARVERDRDDAVRVAPSTALTYAGEPGSDSTMRSPRASPAAASAPAVRRCAAVLSAAVIGPFTGFPCHLVRRQVCCTDSAPCC